MPQILNKLEVVFSLIYFHVDAVQSQKSLSILPRIGHANVWSHLLATLENYPISLQYAWLNNEQPIRVWLGRIQRSLVISNKQEDNSIIIIPCYVTATGRALGSKGWTLLLRTLTLQLNSNLNDDDRAFALALCASDIFQDLLKRYPSLNVCIIIYYEV